MILNAVVIVTEAYQLPGGVVWRKLLVKVQVCGTDKGSGTKCSQIQAVGQKASR